MKAREGESRHPVQWPTLSDTKAEETLETVHLFATTLYYEIAPLLESIRSNAELLHEAAEAGALESKKEGRKISPSMCDAASPDPLSGIVFLW